MKAITLKSTQFQTNIHSTAACKEGSWQQANAASRILKRSVRTPRSLE
jgi:hypothetical protein